MQRLPQGSLAGNTKNGSDNANANIIEIAKHVQQVHGTAKKGRQSLRTGSTPSDSAIDRGLKEGGIFASLGKGATGTTPWGNWLSPGSGPTTRFDKSKGASVGSTSYLTTRNSSRMNSPLGGPVTRAEQRRAAMRGDYNFSDANSETSGGFLQRYLGLDLVARVIYVLKFLRIFVVAGSLYLASKTFQSKYVTTVFVNNEPPPNLIGFIGTFVLIEAIFMGLILFIVMLLAKTLSMNDIFPITDEVFNLFVFDSIVASVITAVIGILLAMVITKKKYFRYRTDGLRAIRSIQEMMLNVAIVTSLLPYFVIDRVRR